MSNTADVIIIGGGIHGASLAFHLTQKGVRPLILERRFLTAGATGRSSGLVRMHYDLAVESRLAWESFHFFRDWEERVGGNCGFTRTGFLQLVPPDHIDQLKQNVALHQAIGISTLLIDAQDVKRLYPHFKTDDIVLAAYEPESGYADPYASAYSLMQAARDKGAVYKQDCEVTGIQVSGGKVTGVSTLQGDFSAPVVVNVAGAWAAGVGKMAGVDLPLTTWRHDTMFIRRPHDLRLSHPTVIDNVYSLYFRPETGGLTLVGLEDNNPLGESPEGDTDYAKPGFTEQAIERICQRIPALENGSLHSAHGGYDGISPDQRAMLGKIGPDGFYVTCGFSGTGFKIAPAVGQCMAELIVDGESQLVDITPFAPTRFEEGKSLTGDHSYGDLWH